MPAISSTAPGKVILCGEHAVVYSQPALAVPVMQVKTRAVVEANPRGEQGQVLISAPDIQLEASLSSLPPEDPFTILFQTIKSALNISYFPACRLRVQSSIPVAAGMGSGAAVSVAVIRAVSQFLGSPLNDQRVSDLAYEVEKVHHGTPSGIDNTVIAFARPIYYVRDHPIALLKVIAPFTIIIADSGIKSGTVSVVQDLRKRWQTDPAQYQPLFEQIGSLVRNARTAIENGKFADLGQIMTQNHRMLQELDVSCPMLDQLVTNALQAGALGAKLSGAGRGGNMIALVDRTNASRVEQTLKESGAVRIISTTIQPAQEKENEC